MLFFFQRIFYTFLIRPWLNLIIGVRFQNQEMLREIGQCIIVANHNSHFDTVSIMAALPAKRRKSTHAVAAKEYFGKKKWAVFLMRLFFNSILINRERQEGEISAIEQMDQYLKEGKSLILFPEGTRGQAGVITDFKKGIAVLLQKNPRVPFIPVYLDGFGRVLPKDKFLIVPLVCKVRFGEPIYPKTEDIDSILNLVREAIMSLKKKDERDRNLFKFG